MARYIDADKMVSEDNAYTTFPHDLAGCDDNDWVRWINEQPTADVVPKSEVERLRFNLQAVLDEIPETKRELAKEIFEDIQNTCGYSVAEHDGVEQYHTKCYSIMATKLDELKKKYTESEGKG